MLEWLRNAGTFIVAIGLLVLAWIATWWIPKHAR